MTTPQDLHQKVRALQLQLDIMTSQLRTIKDGIGLLVAGCDGEMAAAAKGVQQSIEHFVEVARSEGEAKIAEVKRLLESSS